MVRLWSRSFNVVTLRCALLVLEWVTVFGRVNYYYYYYFIIIIIIIIIIIKNECHSNIIVDRLQGCSNYLGYVTNYPGQLSLANHPLTVGRSNEYQQAG